MNFGASPRSRTPRRQMGRRQLTQQDLVMYEALIGRAVELTPEPVAAAQLPKGMAPIRTVASRWKPTVTDLTVRLRAMYAQSINQNMKPQVTDWLRHMSEAAMKRLDEAHVRLNASRTQTNRRKVVAWEIDPARAAETVRPAKAA